MVGRVLSLGCEVGYCTRMDVVETVGLKAGVSNIGGLRV